jgi:hypothetical protein
MNNTDYPSIAANDVVAGFVFQKQEATSSDNIDRKSMETSCVDLICKLENHLAKAMAMPRVDFIDESAEVARDMLNDLLKFSDSFLGGKAAEQAKEEIERAQTYSDTFDEVLKTRPLLNTIARTFWSVDEKAEIQTAFAQLGAAVIRGCAATLYHAIVLIGVDTELGQQIDQSTVYFVSELQQSWK